MTAGWKPAVHSPHMKNRFYVPQSMAIGGVVGLAGEEFHHAVRVHRSRVGEEVELFDGSGNAFVGRIESIAKDSATVVLVAPAERRDPRTQLHLALALIQPEKFELVLQKATELGISSFIPLISEHCEVRPERAASKLDRWRKVVLEATKQSGRATIPPIKEASRFDAVIAAPGARIVFEAERSPENLAISHPVTLLVGPEGGWSKAELDAAAAAGCSFRRLGPRRLRAETAAIAAVTLVGYTHGELA